MVDFNVYGKKQCDNTFAFRVNVAKIKEDGNFSLIIMFLIKKNSIFVTRLRDKK